MRGERLRAVADDPRDQREVSTLLISVGLPHSPACGGKRRAQPRHAAPAFDRGDQRRLLAADERAGAFLDGQAQRVIASRAAARPASRASRTAAIAARTRCTASGYSWRM